uniref:Coiled-coil domain-containing protein 170 n=1 Tax=Schistocephalus solidus TaxID=70667 RepID=A0A0V0J4J7_SCHSO
MAQQDDSSSQILEGQPQVPSQINELKIFYEQELKRKDEIIRKLSKIQPPADERCSTAPQDSITSTDKIERLKVKLRHLNQAIEEGRVHLKEHEERIHDLTIENECLSIENLELSAQKDTIKRELMSAQDRLREYAAAENRNEVAILSLQEEIHSKQENVCELMDRINKLNSNTSDKLFSQETEIQNHKEGLQTIASLLACKHSYEACSEEIKELIQKKTTLEGQVSRLRDTLASSEFEQRAARETTMRLSGELNREVNARDNAQTEVKETQKELEATKALLERSEASARLLRDRIQTLTEALDKAHSDFDKREAELRRIATLNGSMHTPVHPGSPNDLPVSPRLSKRYEEECNHFQEFLHFGRYYLNKDADAPSGVILKELRSRLVNLEAELGKTKMAFIKCQGDTGEAESAINSRDSRILQLEETVERLRNELAEVSVVNEALRKDKCSLNSFLMKVADHLKLDELAAEAEIPLLMDAVFTRLRQILTGEGERTAGQRVKIVRLQQKLRELTDRNESLELQVNILRRRLNEQEEPRAASPRRPATSLTDADRRRRRITKQVEQMRAEILSLQAENLQLKAQSLNENKASVILAW